MLPMDLLRFEDQLDEREVVYGANFREREVVANRLHEGSVSQARPDRQAEAERSAHMATLNRHAPLRAARKAGAHAESAVKTVNAPTRTARVAPTPTLHGEQFRIQPMAPGDADSPDYELEADAPSEAEASWFAPDAGRRAMATIPPLAMLATVAALVHLALQKLLLPLMAAQKLSLPSVLLVVSPFARNLAALAGIVALASSVLDVVRSRLTYVSRRVLIAGLSGILLSTLALASLAPEAYLTSSHVLVATGALHTMIVQLAMLTLRAQRSLAGRTTACLVATASVLPLFALLVRHGQGTWLAWLRAFEGVVPAVYGLGEIAYLTMPIAAAFVVVPWEDAPSGRFARRAGAAAVVITAALFAAGARMPNELYGQVLYATLRLTWALEEASLGYAVPVSLATGAAAAALFSKDARHRQGGAGLWLWLAAGFNPLTPARLGMAGLGAMLVCRAVISLWQPGDKSGASA